MQIKVTISPTAEVKITTKGYKGRTCLDATRDLERALGVTTADKPTEEMHSGTDQTVDQ